MGNATSGLTVTITAKLGDAVVIYKIAYPIETTPEAVKTIEELRKLLQMDGEKIITSIFISMNNAVAVFEPREDNVLQLINLSKEAPTAPKSTSANTGVINYGLQKLAECAPVTPVDVDIIKGSIVIETLQIELKFGTQCRGCKNIRESDAARLFASHLALLFSTYNARYATLVYVNDIMPEKHQNIITAMISVYKKT